MSFLSFVDESFITLAGALMIICFLLWELPRSLRLLDEENERLVYSSSGRVFDGALFAIGILSFVFYLVQKNAVLDALRSPTFSLAFSVVYLAVPILVLLNFAKKALKTLNDSQSYSKFFIGSLFGFFHSIFLVCFSLVFLAVAIFLFLNFYR